MTKTHTVTIDGKEYEFDVEKAVKEGFLREIANYPLESGDVYKHDYRTSVILIKPLYREESGGYLIGPNLNPFSDLELRKILNNKEISTWLHTNKYKFSHNINEKVAELIEKP